MSHSLKPVQSGDAFDTSAALFNRLVDLLRAAGPGTQTQGGAVLEQMRTTTLIRNLTTIDIERGEIVPIGGIYRAPWKGSGYDSSLAVAYRAAVITDGNYGTPTKVPKYSKWGVALEPIPYGRFGRIVTGGVALVKLTDWDRTFGDDSRQPQWADVHPSPDSETRERWQLLPRNHGRARILARGEVDGQGYALIDMDQPRWLIPIQAQTTSPLSVNRNVYTSHDKAPDSVDVIYVQPISNYWGRMPGIGKDDLTDEYKGTCGWAQWDGIAFRPILWPGEFLVESQRALDSNFQYYGQTMKFWHPEAAVAVGDTFDVVKPHPRYIYGGSATPSPTWFTYAWRADSILAVHRRSPYIATGLVADARSILAAPDGEIRMLTGVALTGDGPWPGWIWADGRTVPTYGATLDLSDRFMRGPNTYDIDGLLGAYGGYATHDGAALSGHDEHPTVFAPAGGVTVREAPGAGGANWGLLHSETDNEPPWYAVAYAQRVDHTGSL